MIASIHELFKAFSGGQFEPVYTGQFQPVKGGQFKSVGGGQFHRFLHIIFFRQFSRSLEFLILLFQDKRMRILFETSF
jgi:hypothetical protein